MAACDNETPAFALFVFGPAGEDLGYLHDVYIHFPLKLSTVRKALTYLVENPEAQVWCPL